MNKPLFTGTCTALVTPFLDGRVNYPMLELLLRRQIDAGISTVVVCGTTGEASTLSDSEKLEILRRCKKYAGSQCMIICGTGSNNTAHAIALSREAEENGADALLVVSPYYNKANEDGLVAHYMSIAHAVRIPIILYNVPGRTGLDMPVSVYKRLSIVPNIAGVKEASTEITKISRIIGQCPPSFSVWTGNDDLIVPAVSLGAQGVISVLSNIHPEETDIMVEAALSGDLDTAAQLQRDLQPLIELLFCEVNPIPVKEALKQIGYDCGGYRLPLTEMKRENKDKIIQYFKK